MSKHLAGFIFLAGLAGLFGSATVGHAQEDHQIKAEELLKKAIESGRTGNARAVAKHAEAARNQLIQHNREHPYTHPSLHIYGENPKAEHDDALFEEIALAISEAKRGNARAGGEAASRAYLHLKEKEKSK
ncbi:MAG TPA: small metal-binding protein SmbP [Nitrosospira sp.]|nr:small metal-binding protein SmbP [Nitrosospira sp.]